MISIAPLFDFNNALVSDYFGKDVSDTLSQMFNKKESIYDCMKRYLKYSNLKFDYNKFKRLKSNNKQYSDIFDNVLKRIKAIKII